MSKLLRYFVVALFVCVSTSLYAEVNRVKVVVTNNKKALLPNVSILDLSTRNILGVTDNNGEAVVDVFVGKKVHFLLEEYSGKYKKKEIVLDGKSSTYNVVLKYSKSKGKGVAKDIKR